MPAVHKCRWSLEEDRPEIDFEDRKNAANDWLMVGEVVDGTRPVSEYPRVSVHVDHADATRWDCYMDGGTRGLFSQRFVDAVGVSSFLGLTLLPAQLNEATYYFIRCEEATDCLDRAKSVYETFRSDPTAIKRIDHYAFVGESLPDDACFVLPELPDLLITESVAQRLQAAKLRGLRIQPLP
jgi:hypothetical protein